MCSQEVKITGVRQFSELQCDRLIVLGACTINGDFNATNVYVTGTLVVEGELVTTDLTVSGSLRVSHGITASDVTISGSIYTNGENKIDSLIMSGDGKIYNAHISHIHDPRGVIGEDIQASKLVFGEQSDSSTN